MLTKAREARHIAQRLCRTFKAKQLAKNACTIPPQLPNLPSCLTAVDYDQPMKISSLVKPARRPHDIAIRGRAVYYSYSFDLGPGLNIEKLADQLLLKNLGKSAASPISDEVRFSKSHIETEIILRDIQSIKTLQHALKSGDLSTLSTFRRYFWLSLKVASSGYFQKLRSGNATEETSKTTGEIEDLSVKLDKSQEELRLSQSRSEAWASIRNLAERDRYAPRYFDKIPYIRVEMRQVPYTSFLVGQDVIEVSLLLHTSGVCILTLASAVSTALDLKAMRNCMVSDLNRIDTVNIAAPIYNHYCSANGVQRSKSNDLMREGVGWIALSTSDTAQLTFHSVFEIYRDAIRSVFGSGGRNDWSSYTMLSIGAPVCACEGKAAKDRHRHDLALTALRATSAVPLNADTVSELLANKLKVSDRELWVSAGSAIYANWAANEPDYREDLMQLIPIESAVRQIRQLQQVDRETSTATVRDKKLFASQGMLAVGLQEYRRNLLNGPDDENIINAILSSNSADTLYERLLDRVKILESIVSTRYSRMQTRRSIAITSSGFLVVVMFLMPRISESIRTFERQSKWSKDLVSLASDTLGGRGPLVLFIYFGALALTAFLLVAFSIRWRRSGHRHRQYGLKLPHNKSVDTVGD